MADNKQQAKQEAPKVEAKVETPKTDFVKLVKDATQSMGMTHFTRINLDKHITDQALEGLNAEYLPQGFEVFSNGKSLLLLKS